MIKKMLCAVVLLLPTLVLGAVVTQRLSELEAAPTVRLPIAGYDPVDILHGHFIRLRFDARAFSKKTNYYETTRSNICVCFNPSAPQAIKGEIPVVGEYVQCKKKSEMQCEMWATNAQFFFATQKFFVDERYAMQLDKLVREAAPRPRTSPRNPIVSGPLNPKTTAQTDTETPPRVTMDVAVSKSGALRLKMLNIDGKPWREALGLQE